MTESGTGRRTGTRLGRYEIGRLLGSGGMGEVYEAVDTDKDRTVALKLLHQEVAQDPAFRERFVRESRTVARLADPHIIPIHDYGEIDGVLFLDMRLVDGDSLSGVLRAGGPLPPARAVDVVAQVAGALDAAHASGLVHRDVKPANIQITTGGFPYLLDFGLAITDADTDARMTSAGMFVGSQAYAAPERFNGDAATAAGDVYSLACVLYQALTAQPPFRAPNLAAMMREHFLTAPPRPSETVPVPAAMDAVVARGLAKEPADRYRSCGELAAAARAALTAPAADPAAFDPTAPRPAADPGRTTPVIAAEYPDTMIAPGPSQPSAGQYSTPGASYPVQGAGRSSQPGSQSVPGQLSQPGHASQSGHGSQPGFGSQPGYGAPSSYAQQPGPPAAGHRTPSYPLRPAYPGGPGSGAPRGPGTVPQYPPAAPAQRRGAVLPVLIGLAVIVVVGIVGYLFLNGSGGSGPSGPTRVATATVTATAGAGTDTPTSTTTPFVKSAIPGNATECAPGSATSPLSSVAADNGDGNTYTSCPFALAVRDAYLAAAAKPGDPAQVTAVSPVNGNSYPMTCAGGVTMITCRGGNNAVVYIY